jgi:hypothetical protein
LRGVKEGEISAKQAIKRLERSRPWVWTAIDPVSKLLVAIEVGPRTLEMAQRVVHHVVGVLAPGCLPAWFSDGFKTTFRTEALILANLLSVKPHLSLSPELQHVPGLLRAVEDDGGLSRETQDLHPHKGGEHPPRGGGLEACAFVVRQGGLVVLERGAHAVLSGGIDEHTAGHHQAQGHDALGLVEREGGGQKLRGFQEAKPACRPGLPCRAGEPGLGGSLPLVQCVCREDTPALLVNAGPTVRAPRRPGPGHLVDDLVGLGPRAWAPALARVRRGAAGAGVEHGGLQA